MSSNTMNAEQRADARKKSENKAQRRKILIIVVAVLVVGFAYFRSIISLKIENAKLKEQHTKLIEERKKIKKKLKNVDNVAYIEEQARKQLQLMYPDEILFKFEEEESKDAKK